jgi:hypothetical protein
VPTFNEPDALPRKLAARFGLDGGNRRPVAFVEDASGFCVLRPSCGSFHEFHADGALQRDQRSVQGLQGAPKMARGRRLAAVLDDCQEGFEIVETFPLQHTAFGMLYHIQPLRGRQADSPT